MALHPPGAETAAAFEKQRRTRVVRKSDTDLHRSKSEGVGPWREDVGNNGFHRLPLPVERGKRLTNVGTADKPIRFTNFKTIVKHQSNAPRAFSHG